MDDCFLPGCSCSWLKKTYASKLSAKIAQHCACTYKAMSGHLARKWSGEYSPAFLTVFNWPNDLAKISETLVSRHGSYWEFQLKACKTVPEAQQRRSPSLSIPPFCFWLSVWGSLELSVSRRKALSHGRLSFQIWKAFLSLCALNLLSWIC